MDPSPSKSERSGSSAPLPAFPNAKQLFPPSPTPPPASLPNGESKSSSVPSHLYARLPPHLMLPTNPPTPDYARLIILSKPLISDLIQPTPLTRAPMMEASLGCEVLMKREDRMDEVFSFKVRGAYNLMKHLTEEEKWRGVVACSAGNHAQGVAMAGRKLGIACTIVMPLATPSIKTRNVERLGAKVVLHGADFDEAKMECARLEKVYGLTNIPPYDDPYVIAGQGTVALEIFHQTNPEEIDAIFVCVGGGGLLAGIAAYVKRIAPPGLKVIGVETMDGDAMTRSRASGKRELLSEVGLFSDGTAVRIVGEETFRVCNELVDEMVLVNNDEICAAIKNVFEDTRSIPEPAGALAVAGMKKYIQNHGLLGSGKRFVSVVSGANMNFDRLRFVAERAALGERKEALLSVIIPEQPGAFYKLHSHIHPRACTEFSYRYSSASRAYIFTSFYLSYKSPTAPNSLLPSTATPEELRQQEISDILKAIKADGMEPRDISDNEMAKSHARYLIGGRKKVENERVFRFEFPERPGALKKFLTGLQAGNFNVSLFHYRNHGADLGKILAGIQVPPADAEKFDDFLSSLGYPYVDETENEVYRHFLGDDE